MLLQRRRDHRCLQLEEARTDEAPVQTRLLLAVMVFRRGPAFHERVIPLVSERVMQVSHDAGLGQAVVALCHGCGQARMPC
jgi:hypothetical protein